MGFFGFTVIVVVLISVVVGIVMLRKPPEWELMNSDFDVAPTKETAAQVAEDEEQMRAALIRATEQRGALAPRATRNLGSTGEPWGHLDPELVTEARDLIARRTRRLTAAGETPPSEQDELVRLLGPPTL